MSKNLKNLKPDKIRKNPKESPFSLKKSEVFEKYFCLPKRRKKCYTFSFLMLGILNLTRTQGGSTSVTKEGQRTKDKGNPCVSYRMIQRENVLQNMIYLPSAASFHSVFNIWEEFEVDSRESLIYNNIYIYIFFLNGC